MVEAVGVEPTSKTLSSLGHSQAYLLYSQSKKVSRKNIHPYRESGSHLKTGYHFDLVYFGGINHLS